MDTRFKKFTGIFALVALCLLSAPEAHPYTLSGGRLVEDFSTDDFADYTNTTGLWNIVDHLAQAAVVAAATSTQVVSFGDGSDGTVDTSGGYTFDTSSHPNGYNFKSVNITGGNVTVTGRNTLIIRSLTTLNITPLINVRGNNGSAGTANGATSNAGASAITCLADGGAGGTATAAAVSAGAGGTGVRSDGTAGTNTGGAANNTAAAAAGTNGAAQAAADRPPAIAGWDTTFSCGTGGAGGGGHSQAAGNFGLGGAGGSSGGRVRIAAVGNITLTNGVDATGGDGGAGAASGAICGGNGGGGSGGAVWLQSAKTITSPASASVVGSAAPGLLIAPGAGANNGCTTDGAASDGGNGRVRVDAQAVAGGVAQNNSTTNTAASQSYVVQSKAYDLGTLNAVFSETPSVTSTANGGSISVQYAGSSNNSTFSDFVSDITQLSSKNYRYLKFRINIATGASGTPPSVSQLAINFSDAGVETIKLKISPGCGTLSRDDNDGMPLNEGLKLFAGWFSFLALAYAILRLRVRVKN